MLSRQFILSSQTGFFHVAALVILLALGAAIYILAGQLKNPTNWLSQAAEVPTTCTGKLEIPSCYDDGTPTAINVSWTAPKNPDRDCNVYLNGADPGVQQVVSTECTGQKTYTYTTDRLLGNPLGNQDIYQLGLDNGQAGCTVKQLSEIRATEMCPEKRRTAGPKPAPPAPESTEDCQSKIQEKFGLTFTGFPPKASCAIHQQLKDINAKFNIVAKLQNLKTNFEYVANFNPNNDNCQNRLITNLPENDDKGTQAIMLANYIYLLLSCEPEKTNLIRDANNLWQEYGGVTPATYNPKPLKADPQPKPSCDSEYAKIPRNFDGEIITNDYAAALATLVDPNFLKNYQKLRGNKYCTEANLYDKGANTRHCLFSEKVLTPKVPSVCGAIKDPPVGGNTQFGIQIDYEGAKIPTKAQFDNLSPQWSRFVYKYKNPPGNNNSTSNLVIFNQQSFEGSSFPLVSKAADWKNDPSRWKDYLENNTKGYYASLRRYLNSKPNLQAIEIWNEPDVCVDNYCPKLPPATFVAMLKESARISKQINPNIKVIAGGLAGPDAPNYLQQLKSIDQDVFAQIDGIGLHPYGQSPNGWKQGSALNGDLGWLIDQVAKITNKPIWITEIGQNFPKPTQAEYLEKIFTVFKQQNLPVAIWYAWSDTMKGGSSNQSGFGLYDDQQIIKPSGEMFAKFAKGVK